MKLSKKQKLMQRDLLFGVASGLALTGLYWWAIPDAAPWAYLVSFFFGLVAGNAVSVQTRATNRQAYDD